MEVKRVNISWYEKIDMSENELAYAEELLAVDKDLAECDNILSEVGLQIGYSRYEKQIYEIAEKRQHLCSFVMALPDYMESHLDEPLRKNLNHGASETISRIHVMDFQVDNTLGVQVQVDTRGYADITFSKDKLTLKDFLGNAIGENTRTCVPNLSGRTCDCVEEFAAIFQHQYDSMLAMGMLDDDIKALEDYLDQLISMGEYDHKEDQPFYKELLSNVLDLTIIKPIIESCCGYDLITKEDLTEMERSMKVVGALVDLVTLATGVYGFTTAAKSMGWKKAASYFGQLALVELAADVSATTVATIGNRCDWPMGVTLLLSLGTGLTVGQVGNHLIFKRNGIEIFRKEVSESGELLEDLMSPEDAARFQKFLEEGSTAGLTPEELAGIGKVDDYVALNKVYYDDVLVLRREAIADGRTGTVWDNITPTQPMREGTQIPLSFNIYINGQEFWVAPNATKHMQEYITRDGQHIGTFTMPVSSQAMLSEFESALSTAINNGLKYNEMIYGGGWEFIIVPPRQEGLNYVIKHARYNP